MNTFRRCTLALIASLAPFFTLEAKAAPVAFQRSVDKLTLTVSQPNPSSPVLLTAISEANLINGTPPAFLQYVFSNFVLSGASGPDTFFSGGNLTVNQVSSTNTFIAQLFTATAVPMVNVRVPTGTTYFFTDTGLGSFSGVSYFEIIPNTGILANILDTDAIDTRNSNRYGTNMTDLEVTTQLKEDLCNFTATSISCTNVTGILSGYIDATRVPVPGSLVLAGLGLSALGLVRRRQSLRPAAPL